jgi:hypothetical protein
VDLEAKMILYSGAKIKYNNQTAKEDHASVVYRKTGRNGKCRFLEALGKDILARFLLKKWLLEFMIAFP